MNIKQNSYNDLIKKITDLEKENAEFSKKLSLFQQIFTSKKEIEQKRSVRNEELNTLFDCVLDLLCIADINGRFTRLNKEWEHVLGYTLNSICNNQRQDQSPWCRLH